ncbi:hypothetical protein HOD05_02415 [Candidatus Woesearchaeota archaeon]|jgi:PhoH-like ATPase|nr:hypothetical protein [Candidatus Woesearchaeota archaeon]MBT4150561.1 hypothetical protein [Candidatus Woesearchaeota archaeon]MBT4247670.1 hypothetical protein [Candidatus Woesearchaeota archaeon]MBT4434050.1 hypothetical protein [Candidatus Woesearchaeota archaeon]MBT7332265.1 hypothetical protein [Candidatus Woesearchaeota archaeon]
MVNENTYNYVLDTNVLIRNPDAIYTFDTNRVHLPLTVVRELDKLKKEPGEVGFAAREASRNIESLLGDSSPEQIKSGIKLENGGSFYLLGEEKTGYGDDDILKAAFEIKASGDRKTVLVSKDTNVRIRARAKGLSAEDYMHDKAQIDFDKLFSVEDSLVVPDQLFAEMYEGGGSHGNPKPIVLPDHLRDQVHANQYLQMLSEDEGAREHVKIKRDKIMPLHLKMRNAIENIKPRNIRQLYLLDACLDPDFTIVNGLGRAGTGKTLMAVVAAITQVAKKEKYDRIMVFRPLVDAGSSDIGYLPGNVDDKIGPYFGAIKNLFDFVLQGPGTQTLLADNTLIFNPPNYLRGDTLNNTYMIVDEAQNFTHAELKLIGTRMGEGTKMVTIGDPFQSDLRFNNDERDNSLTKSTAYHRNNPDLEERALFSYVVLKEVERSLSAKAWGGF